MLDVQDNGNDDKSFTGDKNYNTFRTDLSHSSCLLSCNDRYPQRIFYIINHQLVLESPAILAFVFLMYGIN